MIGIYKITKKENGKSYIGQSNDIERRFKEHKTKSDIPIEIAIQKYGVDAFNYEIIEECSLNDLDEKEKYWIAYYNTYKGFGYNCSEGGGDNRDENNGRAQLTNEEVSYIRDCYALHMRRREVYKKFQNKISFNAFASIWDGATWKEIKSEVYTEENKRYYMYEATNGEKSYNACLTDEEVIECRTRYMKETAKEIFKDYKEKITYQAFQAMLWGRSYKNLPIYSKKKKEWINK